MKTRGVTAKNKGGMRTLVHKGARSQRTPEVAQRTRKLAGETMCERCGNVYRDKRWHEGTAGERAWPVGFAWTVCPACRQFETQEFFGRIVVRGKGALGREDEIRTRVENVAARARFTQPQRRVLSFERLTDTLEILTSSQKLAHRIVASLMQAFGGHGAFAWSAEHGELTATWTWDDAAPKRAAPARRLTARERGAVARQKAAAVGKQPPDLGIQCRHVELAPAWRDRIERAADTWAERYPDVTRIHVTLAHAGHHRHGFEEVTVAATVPGRRVHVAKRGETMMVALREALQATERELRVAHEVRRHDLS